MRENARKTKKKRGNRSFLASLFVVTHRRVELSFDACNTRIIQSADNILTTEAARSSRTAFSFMLFSVDLRVSRPSSRSRTREACARLRTNFGRCVRGWNFAQSFRNRSVRIAQIADFARVYIKGMRGKTRKIAHDSRDFVNISA